MSTKLNLHILPLTPLLVKINSRKTRRNHTLQKYLLTKIRHIKGAVSFVRQFESPLKMMKNAFISP